MKKNCKQKLGNIFGIIAGIIWIHLGASQHYSETYVNILIVLIGIVSIILNISLFKDNIKKMIN